MIELKGTIRHANPVNGQMFAAPIYIGPEAMPLPATATVGQIISVLNVDDDGKVTEVEAIDLPRVDVNTLGTEIPIAENLTVPGFVQGFSGNYSVTVPMPLELVGGASYKVTFDETEAYCNCYTEIESEGGNFSGTGFFVGNASLVQPNLPDTGEQFFVMAGDSTTIITSRAGESHIVSLYLVDRVATEGLVMEYIEQNVPDGIATEAFVRNYVEQNVPDGLPDVSATDNDKILQVVDGEWAKVEKDSPATSINLSGFESEGRIVETFADGSTATTVMEFDADGKPTKITDGNGNVTVLTW